MNQPPPASSHIPWRPAFVQAIKLKLEPYRHALELLKQGYTVEQLEQMSPSA
jgi:hypothetical protein